MKLSNTLLISRDLLPSYNKAFTLAEVLITLTILGVVAAITIPSLINRQNEVAAKTKIKKAIANYESVAATYMAENECQDLQNETAGALATNFKSYFKVTDGDSASGFKTSDNVYWMMADNGSAVICDTDSSPKYCVTIGVDTDTGNVDQEYDIDNAEEGSAFSGTAKAFMNAYSS